MADAATTFCDNFCNEYYNTLSTNRAGLINMFSERSTMTYCDEKFTGLGPIQEKISSFTFQTVFSLFR